MRNGFTINGRLPSLNDYVDACRTHWSKGAALKAQTEELIFWSIRSAKNKGECRPARGPVAVAFLWHENGMRRDADNIYSAKKYILDAMQTAGIIENDNRKHVLDCLDMGIVPAKKGQDKVEVELLEVDTNEWSIDGRGAVYLYFSDCFRLSGGGALPGGEAGEGRRKGV